jgi:hypothetical protein
MLQRLRGDPANPATWRVPGVAPFVSRDLNLLLRANDYPPFWRDKLEAISYRVPGIRQLRVQIKQRTITDNEVVEVLRDNGYKLADAQSYAQALILDVSEQRANKLLGIILHETEQGWELGLIDDAQFTSTLIDAGIDPDEAQARVNAAIAGRSVKLGKELVGQVKRGYLRGTFSWTQADQFLTQVGINAPSRNEYKVRWDAARQAGRKEATAGALRKAVLEGSLDIASYAQRLRNLDYTDDAINIAIAGVRVAIANRDAAALAKLAKEEGATIKARLAALKATEAALKAARAELAASASPSKLKTWWCNGEIELADVVDRLRKLGILEVDIPRWLEECDAKRSKAGLPTYAEAKAGS